MIRRTALKALLALPFAPSLLAKAGVPVTKKFDRWAIYNSTGTTLADMIEHWSGGIRPLNARVDPLAGTGDALKFAVVAQHPSGAWFTKTILFSGLFQAVTAGDPHAQSREKAYQIAKRSRELARDWAYLEWGDDWRRHVPPYGRRA